VGREVEVLSGLGAFLENFYRGLTMRILQRRFITLVMVAVFILGANTAFAFANVSNNKITDVNVVETSDVVKAEIDFAHPVLTYEGITVQFLLNTKVQSTLSLEEAMAQFGITVASKGKTLLILQVPKSVLTSGAELLVRFKDGDWYQIYGSETVGEELAPAGEPVMKYNSCSGCQCTDFVHCKTSITFAKCWGKVYGNADQWYDYAKKCDFDRSSSTPEDKSILVMTGGQHGHVIYVTSEKKKSSDEYELKIQDKNWVGACQTDSSTIKYNKKTHKIYRGGKWIANMPVAGFIHKWKKE
jgi:hypothetical protein